MTDTARNIEKLATDLRLPIFARYSDFVKKNRPFEENLLELLREQSVLADNNRLKSQIRYARFPYVKKLDTFDLSPEMYPQLNINEFNELSTCSFIEEKSNVVAIGPPGVGKTHAALAIGYEAIKRGYSVRFRTAIDLINEMREAKTEKLLAKYTKTMSGCKLLIIDEVGYLTHDEEDTNFLFQVIASRYERASTFFTTNFEFSKWSQFISDKPQSDKQLVAAMVGRVAQHAVVLNMNSPKSWRLEHARSRAEAKK